jgi:hypothetical protein
MPTHAVAAHANKPAAIPLRREKPDRLGFILHSLFGYKGVCTLALLKGMTGMQARQRANDSRIECNACGIRDRL